MVSLSSEEFFTLLVSVVNLFTFGVDGYYGWIYIYIYIYFCSWCVRVFVCGH